MNSLPDVKDGQLKTFLPDALHFRRTIQNVRVRDVEVEMPVSHLAIICSLLNFGPDFCFPA